MGRKIFTACIALSLMMLLILPARGTFAASYKTGVYKINTESSNLNVRSCPNSQNMKVGSIPKGTKVNVTLVSGSWGKVVYGTAHGWISLDYCKYIGPLEEAAPAKNADKVQYGISAKNLTWVVGCNQEKSKASGLCTSSATGTLLRRRQAAEGKPVTFTFGDTRTSCGGDPVPDKNGYYKSCNFYYTPQNGWIHTDAKTGEQTVYYTVKEEDKTHTHNREYIADLLDVHPEGIVVYANYGRSGKHAILFSDYVRKSDGSIQFYAYDPANHGVRLKLEQTWMMTHFKSVGGYFENVKSIWYIKGELTVDDSKFEHPEAEAFESNMKVARKNTMTYSEASTASDEIEKLSKGTVIHVNYTVSDDDGDVWYITDDGTYIHSSKVAVTDLEVTETEDEDGEESQTEKGDAADDVEASENVEVAEETEEQADGEAAAADAATDVNAQNAETESEDNDDAGASTGNIIPFIVP